MGDENTSDRRKILSEMTRAAAEDGLYEGDEVFVETRPDTPVPAPPPGHRNLDEAIEALRKHFNRDRRTR